MWAIIFCSIDGDDLPFYWSPDGAHLAVLLKDRVVVLDGETEAYKWQLVRAWIFSSFVCYLLCVVKSRSDESLEVEIGGEADEYVGWSKPRIHLKR